MSARFFRSTGTAAAIAFLLAAVPLAGQAPPAGQAVPPPDARVPGAKKPVPKNWTAPKTPWGHPDLQGLYSNSTIVPLERPANQTKAELTDEEVKARFDQHRGQLFGRRQGDTGFYNEYWWEWGRDANRTSLVIDPPDGKLPTKPEVQPRLRRVYSSALPGTYTDLNILDRCISRSMPGTMMPGFYGHYYQILQTKDYVAIRMELLHDFRIIPLDSRPHIGQGIRQYLGDSRGHWEGNTLVVETTNMNDKVNTWGATFMGIGTDLKLTERFTRIDPDTIEYKFTVEAPSAFTRPWTASIPLWSTDEKIFEYACHEGNYAMTNSLSGARAEEAAGPAGGPAQPQR
jgi:hypothetical protein